MKDPYEILGVSRDVDASTIRMAYRAKAKQVHPDAGGNDEAFAELFMAYEILSNEPRRQKYDQTGHMDDSHQAISAGALAIFEGLLNGLAQREDAKYTDLAAVMSTEISHAMRSKLANIELLEKNEFTLYDLKNRFRSKIGRNEENIFANILEKKIELILKKLEAERLALAQLNEASRLLQGYYFVRECRPGQRRVETIDSAYLDDRSIRS